MRLTRYRSEQNWAFWQKLLSMTIWIRKKTQTMRFWWVFSSESNRICVCMATAAWLRLYEKGMSIPRNRLAIGVWAGIRNEHDFSSNKFPSINHLSGIETLRIFVTKNQIRFKTFQILAVNPDRTKVLEINEHLDHPAMENRHVSGLCWMKNNCTRWGEYKFSYSIFEARSLQRSLAKIHWSCVSSPPLPPTY